MINTATNMDGSKKYADQKKPTQNMTHYVAPFSIKFQTTVTNQNSSSLCMGFKGELGNFLGDRRALNLDLSNSYMSL